MFAVNTLGPFYFSRAVVRSWLDLPVSVSSGDDKKLDITKISDKKLDKQILFISSISGLVAMSPQRQAAYNASKGGLTMLAKVRHLLRYRSTLCPVAKGKGNVCAGTYEGAAAAGRSGKSDGGNVLLSVMRVEANICSRWRRNGRTSVSTSTRSHLYVTLLYIVALGMGPRSPAAGTARAGQSGSPVPLPLLEGGHVQKSTKWAQR
jgi:hypothetical protein